MKILLSILLMFLSASFYAQQHNLPPPQTEDPGGPVVVPPGLILPIDNGVIGLMAAGLVLGVYYIRSKKMYITTI